MRPRALLPTLLTVAALLAAGCGGADPETTNAYVEEVTKAQRTFVTRFEQVRQRLEPTSTDPEDRATLRAFSRATRTFATALRRVDPPGRVAEEHRKLVSAVAGYQRQVDKAEAGLGKGDADARARARTRLATSVESTQRDVVDAIEAINQGLRD